MADLLPYLSGLAEKVYQAHYPHFERLALLFPSPKAAHAFRKALAAKLPQPCWSPPILLWGDLMQQLHKKPCLSELHLLGSLYHIITQEKHDPISFDRFYAWGKAFLTDLKRLAHYRIPLAKCFTGEPKPTLCEELSSEQQAMLQHFWAQIKQGPIWKDFLGLWQRLPAIYKALHHHLAAQGVSYEGRHEQEVYELLLAGKVALPFDQLIGVGLHPITPLMKAILDQLDSVSKVDLYYDVDGYYMEGGVEAGHHLQIYATDPLLGRHLQPPYPQTIVKRQGIVTLLPAAGPVEEAEKVVKVLQELTTSADFQAQSVSIVLADPGLLIPLLDLLPSAIPLDIDINYPLQHTPIAGLTTSLLHFHACWSAGSKAPSLLRSALAELLVHPYIALPQREATKLLEVAGKDPTQLTTIATRPIWQHILTPPRLYGNLWAYMEDFLALLDSQSDLAKREGLRRWARAAIAQVTTLCTTLKKVFFSIGNRGVSSLIVRFWAKQIATLSFACHRPDPMGIKVIPLSEAAYLDSKYCFLLGMNEGIFPKNKRDDSLIPLPLQEVHGLPTSGENSIEDAYFFYRLLQRVHHLYCSFQEGKKRSGGVLERSRYLLQLQYELPQIVAAARPERVGFSLSESIPIVVTKTQKVMALLDHFKVGKKRYLSPSAINTLLTCQLRFYFQYIIKLQGEEPKYSLLSQITFGNMLHTIMERLYKPYVGRIVTKEVIAQLRKAQPQVIERVVSEYASEIARDQLRIDRLIAYVLGIYVTHILTIDEASVPLKLLGVEYTPQKKPSLQLSNGKKVNIGGTIDRIDQQGNQVRLLDYKTSLVDRILPHIEELFNPDNEKRNKVALQLLWYGWLYAKEPNRPTDITIAPSVITTRTRFDSPPETQLWVAKEKGKKYPLQDIAPYLQSFEEELRNLLDGLFDQKKPFLQTNQLERCTSCPYRKLCQR